MRETISQGLLLLYCFLTLLKVPVDTEFVAAFLTAVVCVSAVRLKVPAGRTFVFMMLYVCIACFLPKLLLFCPVMFYNILEHRKYIPGLLLGGLCFFSYGKAEGGTLAILLLGCVLACFFVYQAKEYETLEEMFRRTRDDGKELTLLLEERNKSILKRQDDEIYTARLKERNRIAREIHDHVGHMLSRAILMTGAMKAVNREEGMKRQLDQLEETLNTAMTNVRESVHDLHDDSVNLKEVLTGLVEEYTFCEARLTYDMDYILPKDVKYGFIAIVKEALNNVSKHSNADRVEIVAREHPGLYQLMIEDNGTGAEALRNSVIYEGSKTEGIGIRNMKDRVRALGGNIQIKKEKGFRIYITVPKKEENA